MIISKEQIEKIRDIVRQHNNYLLLKMSGKDFLSPEDIKELLAEGILTEEDQKNLGIFEDAYHIGRDRQDLKKPYQRESITLDQFRKKYEKPVRLSEAEEYAIEHIRLSGGNLITALGDKTRSTVEQIINNANLEFRNKVLDDTIRPVLIHGIEEDRTVRQIASDLRDATGDLFRDWKRVSVTELTNALNLGEADAIVNRNPEKDSDEIYVFKHVVEDNALCMTCRKLYLDSNGKPKVFKLSELQANGTNYGKKQAEWLPVIGVTHPNCRCQLMEMPPGFGFDSYSEVTYRGPKYNYYNKK